MNWEFFCVLGSLEVLCGNGDSDFTAVVRWLLGYYCGSIKHSLNNLCVCP